MPYAFSQDGVRIHYQTEGSGPPLLLQHGFGGSLDAWRQFGYLQALRRDHQTVLLDARGHGASDKPHEQAAYALERRVADVIAVLDALGIPKVVFAGYSMGGWIGFGMAKHAPQRLRALIIGGAHPFADTRWNAFKHIDGHDPEAFIAALEAVVAQAIAPQDRALVLANDLRALAAAAQVRPSLEDVLATWTLPCLLYAGQADPRYVAVQACARRLRHATLVTLPGVDHSGGFLRSDLVTPPLMRFLAALEAAGHAPN